MPLADIAVLLSIAISTPALVVLLRRRGLRGRRLFSAGLVGFYGVVLVVTMTAHCIDIFSRLCVGKGYDGAAFTYDFRVYGLMLLGVLLIACGARLLRSALEAGHADAARGTAARTTLLVLAVVAPLIPIHSFFAIPLTALGVLTLVVLAFAGVRPRPRTHAQPVLEQIEARVPAGV
ncbi:MAG TPA: hypothetical protein VGV85_18350 [Longimicrobiaceae bacterium]|nr:hypothetical protein [Longimicrobiaceae bacterium]